MKGTGCLLSGKYLLTVAHNMIEKKQRISELENLKAIVKDESYVKQGLGVDKAEY